MRVVNDVILADAGKIFRRIADGTLYGKDIALGYTYNIGGNWLTVPHKDVPEDFEEIDDNGEYYVEEEVFVSDLDKAKKTMIGLITEYDTSDNVNQFFYNDIPCWIDKATRVGLVNSTNMEIKLGRTETTLILNDVVVTLPCDTILNMLATLEVYAKDCYNVTANHIINVNNMSDIDLINEYDYTVGYPEKIRF